MHVDFRAFERLAIFVRGDSMQRRVLRRVRHGMLAQECEVPIYKRVVMLMKFRPHRKLDRMLDPERVFFQLFKDIPKEQATVGALRALATDVDTSTTTKAEYRRRYDAAASA